jgi:branched-subunit amino acid transport protein AzlD
MYKEWAKKNKPEWPSVIVSLLWLLLGLFICVKAVGLEVGRINSPGPGFMPFVEGAALICLSVLLLAGEYWSAGEKGRVTLKMQRVPRLLAVAAVLLFYGLLLEWIGFVLVTAGALLALLRIIKPVKWVKSILISVVATFIIYMVLVRFLSVRLPEGIFF